VLEGRVGAAVGHHVHVHRHGGEVRRAAAEIPHEQRPSRDVEHERRARAVLAHRVVEDGLGVAVASLVPEVGVVGAHLEPVGARVVDVGLGEGRGAEGVRVRRLAEVEVGEAGVARHALLQVLLDHVPEPVGLLRPRERVGRSLGGLGARLGGGAPGESDREEDGGNSCLAHRSEPPGIAAGHEQGGCQVVRGPEGSQGAVPGPEPGAIGSRRQRFVTGTGSVTSRYAAGRTLAWERKRWNTSRSPCAAKERWRSSR
jgi:hypothetical protein